jgi:hypothetical protein
LAQGDADVLNSVVTIDVQIAFTGNVQIYQSMPGNLVEHVVQKTDACVQLGQPGAVQVQGDADLRFGRLASDFSGAGHSASFRASKS